jgi:peptidoglycan/LPS O-acetylase OafA/YrhL
MIRHLLADGNPFFMGSPFKLLLTVIGFDGYVKLFGFSTYAFCGDWFVGAIVMLYLLYPLLAKCYRNFPVVTLIVLAGLYAAQFLLPAEQDDILSALPATLMFKFVIGFALIENLERLKDWRVAAGAGVAFAALTFVDIPGRLNTDALGTFASFALFAFLFYLAPQLLRFKAASVPIQKLATLSYCVFLVQHVGIVWAQGAFVKIFEKMHWNFTQWNVLALLACTLVIIVIVAWILKLLSDKLVQKR